MLSAVQKLILVPVLLLFGQAQAQGGKTVSHYPEEEKERQRKEKEAVGPDHKPHKLMQHSGIHHHAHIHWGAGKHGQPWMKRGPQLGHPHRQKSSKPSKDRHNRVKKGGLKVEVHPHMQKPIMCRNYEPKAHKSLYDFPPEKTLEGGTVRFEDLKEKVVFIANVPVHGEQAFQIEDLNELHDEFTSQGLVILGIPTNEFGHLEDRPDEEILVDLHEHGHKPKFPILEPMDVNGKKGHDLFKWLKESCGGHPARGHFEKYFVNRWGWPLLRGEELVPVARFRDAVKQFLEAPYQEMKFYDEDDEEEEEDLDIFDPHDGEL